MSSTQAVTMHVFFIGCDKSIFSTSLSALSYPRVDPPRCATCNLDELLVNVYLFGHIICIN